MPVAKVSCKDIPDALVIRLAMEWREGGEPVGNVLSSIYGEKLASAKIDRLVDRGLLDYGVSPRCSWPTQKGIDILEGEKQKCQ